MFNTREEQNVNKVMIFALIGVVILFLTAAGFAAYYFREYRSVKKDSAAAANDEQKRITDKVNKLYNTPNETPSIVQVQDRSKVASQAFFKDTKNGDYVLVYQKAKLAILYRESNNRIINTGPINLDDTEQSSTDKSSTKTNALSDTSGTTKP